MFEVFDRNFRKVAVLQNAYGRTVEEKLNGVGLLSFSLPPDDPKNAYCQPFAYVRDDEGVYYRILIDGIKEGTNEERSYQAEHCIATLVDDLMFGTHMIGGIGIYTREVIEYILGRQTTRHWQLGDCDFSMQFEYGFESENLLNALYSVPNLMVDRYMWVYDMSVYPWKVHLRKLDEEAHPQFYLRAGKNLLQADATRSMTSVCTRLFLRGYGEGDNQLTIQEINGGLPYLQAPQAYIDRYGLISKEYVDRQFEDAESLMARGQAILRESQEPRYARTFTVADLSEITRDEMDRARAGDLVRLQEDDTVAFVTTVERKLDVAGDMRITLSNTTEDIVADIADLADRQRIEQVYSQGATQIYAQSLQANADSQTAAVLSFYIPEEMRIINKVIAKISIESFRTYARSTDGGGGMVATSSDGGGGATTSRSSGGGNITSGPSTKQTVGISNVWTGLPDFPNTDGSTSWTDVNDGSTGVVDVSLATLYASTSSAGSGTTGTAAPATGGVSVLNTGYAAGTGSHRHSMGHTHTVNSHGHSMGAHTHTYNHTHTVQNGRHSHSMRHQHQVQSHSHKHEHMHKLDHTHDISHTHTVSVSAHTHSVDLPEHSHQVEVPTHTHGIEHGIFRAGNPGSAKIIVNGEEKAVMERNIEIDLTQHLLNPSGKISRGSWQRLAILPDDLAYVTIDMHVQGFVQSRGGGTY